MSVEYNGILLDLSRDENLNDFSKTLLKQYYMLNDETSPQEAFGRAALAYCDGDLQFAQRIYDYASKGWFMFASPVLSNAPKPGEAWRALPISCFLTWVDDTLEGLIEHSSELRWLSVKGGGVGGQPVRYLFYPGCSAEASALEYKQSTLAVLEALGADVEEVPDWTCCGASAGPVVSSLLGAALPARNLALAERAGDGRDMLAVCSACYTNFRRTSQALAGDKDLRTKVDKVLEVEGLKYNGTVRARHLMDVLANDFGADAIGPLVRRRLAGLVVAPYYGCQTVRPFSPFDDDQRPESMVAVLEALGVEVYRHEREASCCGTSLLMTKPQVGLAMAGAVLSACRDADCIVTVCPMCHMNLDSYQDKVSRQLGRKVRLPILFLPQLIGLAFGMGEKSLQFSRHVVSVRPVLDRLARPQT